MAHDLPVHYVQMILYAHYRLSCGDDIGRQSEMEAINLSSVQELWEVDNLCRVIPTSETLVQERPRLTMVETRPGDEVTQSCHRRAKAAYRSPPMADWDRGQTIQLGRADCGLLRVPSNFHAGVGREN
jgi:hypothetical protein